MEKEKITNEDVPTHSGKLSGVKAGKKLFQIQTEHVISPSNRVVTIVVFDGKVVLKRKSDPAGSLQADELGALINKQHHAIETEVREKVKSGRP